MFLLYIFFLDGGKSPPGTHRPLAPRSIMVKLLGRAKRLNEALKLAEDYRKVLDILGFLWDLPKR